MSKKEVMSKPELSNSYAQRELDKAEQQFEQFNDSVKEMNLDRMNAAPKHEVEGPRISQKEIDRSKDIYLKPKKTIWAMDPKTGKGQPFNEKFRAEYEYRKEMVQFIAEHKELSGDMIEKWTRPYGGLPAEFWEVPTNKPVWGPRYLAEEIKNKSYHKLTMDDRVTGSDGRAQYFGAIAVESTVQRLDAHSVSQKKSYFMGASGF